MKINESVGEKNNNYDCIKNEIRSNVMSRSPGGSSLCPGTAFRHFFGQNLDQMKYGEKIICF